MFPAPIRGVLDARGEAANRLHREIDGRGLTLQAAAILLKIQEVDLVLQRTPDLHRQVIEVHPELSFKFWKGTPLDHPKRRSAGKSERRVLVDALWPGAVAAAEERLGRKKGRWGTDDLLDAFAALWTARRVVQGVSVEFPRTPESDELGTPMRMFA